MKCACGLIAEFLNYLITFVKNLKNVYVHVPPRLTLLLNEVRFMQNKVDFLTLDQKSHLHLTRFNHLQIKLYSHVLNLMDLRYLSRTGE